MTNNLTIHAREVMEFAVVEAREANRTSIGPADVLLGLARQWAGLAHYLLDHLGVEMTRLREMVLKQVPRGEFGWSKELPYSRQTNQLLQCAHQEAKSLGKDEVDTEHLLLGLLRLTEEAAAKVLVAAKVTYEEVHRLIENLYAGPGFLQNILPTLSVFDAPTTLESVQFLDGIAVTGGLSLGDMRKALGYLGSQRGEMHKRLLMVFFQTICGLGEE